METDVLVLIVEDEAALLSLLQDAMEDGGFKIAAASNADEAISLLDAGDAKYRALVTDVHLTPGGLTGWDVARHAREIESDLPVVYVTGAGGDEWGSKGVPNSVLLIKPFAVVQVLTAVSQLLNLGSAPGA